MTAKPKKYGENLLLEEREGKRGKERTQVQKVAASSRSRGGWGQGLEFAVTSRVPHTLKGSPFAQ